MLKVHVEETESTNTLAKELLEKYDEVLVTADYQSKGRGRNGKKWEAQKNSAVLISFGFKPQSIHNLKTPAFYQACTAVAVRAFLLSYCQEEMIKIKYPNDIIIIRDNHTYKIAGILIETEYQSNSIEKIIVGIGMNCKPLQSLPIKGYQAISLEELSHQSLTLNDTRENLIEKLLLYFMKSPDEIFSEWKQCLNIIGKTIHIKDTQLLVTDITPEGFLICSDGIKKDTIFNIDTIRYQL